MDLEKLKQLDNQNEQNRKKRYEDRMAIPIKEWNEKLNSETFETKLQEELEKELDDGDKLHVSFTVSYRCSSGKSSVLLYGRYVSFYSYIMGVSMHDDEDYSYYNDDVKKLAKQMYNSLKNKLTELGFIITREDGELEVLYETQSEIKLYLKVK